MAKGKTQTIIPPEGGWEEHTLYLVDVAFNAHNPVHQSYFMTGFLNGPENSPCGYNRLWNNTYGGEYDIRDVAFMRAVKKLHTKGDPL